jgi:hypothetical protein
MMALPEKWGVIAMERFRAGFKERVGKKLNERFL